MAPFPDEVDVFTGPHWRMKQLVGLYCEKVRLTCFWIHQSSNKQKKMDEKQAVWRRLQRD